MKERPILFSGPMVRAILEDRKTQTRRVVKMQVCGGRMIEVPADDDAAWVQKVAHNPYGKPAVRSGPTDHEWSTGLPPAEGMYYVRGLLGESLGGDSRAVWVSPQFFTWGFDKFDDPEFIGLDTDITPQNIQWKPAQREQPGDRLWVRESFAVVPATAYRCSTGVQQTLNPGDPDLCAVYREGWERSKPGSWRPSIFMPRWASRITLEITGIRVERLQAISDADALAEGCSAADMRSGDSLASVYARLWESIHGLGSWDANPWVWVVEFRQVVTPTPPKS